MTVLDRVRGWFADAPTWRAWLVVFLAVLAVYLPTATFGPRQSIDTVATATQAWRIASQGTVDLSDRPDTPWLVETEGRAVAARPPGPVLWGSLFYVVFDRGQRAPHEPVPLAPAALAAAVAAAAAVATLGTAFRRLAPGGTALAATALAAFGTTTWAVAGNALWPHSLSQLGLALAVAGDAASRWWTAGAGFGLALAARPYLAAVAAVHGLHGAWTRRRPAMVVRIGVVAGAAAALVAAYNLSLFGSLVAPSHGAIAGRAVSLGGLLGDDPLGGVTFVLRNLVMTFVSPTRGLLPISPFLLLLLPGVRAGWRAAPAWVRTAAVAGVVTLVLQAISNRYTGGDSFFGYRYGLEPLTLWAPLLVLAYREWVAPRPLMRVLFVATAVVAVVYQALGATVLTLGVLL